MSCASESDPTMLDWPANMKTRLELDEFRCVRRSFDGTSFQLRFKVIEFRHCLSQAFADAAKNLR